MYKQSVDAIKLVIISLDGVIYDLNKYRYNYCKHLCENKNIKYSKFEFYTHLSSMYDMYNDFPLIHKADAGLFNAQVEREMKQYLDYKGIKPKDGFIELIEYLHQKNIQIAIVSTHRTKDAVHYLEVNKLFHKVHYIIGSDAVSHPLPSTHILEMILNNFHIPAQNTLVLSSFMALNKAANELKMNVIYCEDLVEAGDLEKDSSYKVASSLFDVLNILLFDKYVEADLYSPILGMSSQMNKNELDSMHNKLKETYQDDEDIINLVDQTYAYHLSHLSTEQTPPPQETPEITSKPQSKKRFTFDDDDDEIEEHTIEPEIEKPSDVSMKTLDEKEEAQLQYLLQQINKQNKSDEIVNSIQKTEEHEFEEETSQEEFIPEEKQLSRPLSILINIIYVFALSFIITFIGLIFTVMFSYQLQDHTGIFGVIYNIFVVYYSIIEMIFSSILNLLHSIISFIPSYQDYSLNNSFFSPTGIQILNIFIFQSIIIGIFKIAFYSLKRRSMYDDNESH